MKGEELFQQAKQELFKWIVKLEDYEIKKEIGKGGNGVVYLGIEKKTNMQVAIKQIRDDKFNDDAMVNFTREIQVLSRCNYPYLLKFIGFTVENPSIITKYIPGESLFQRLHSIKSEPLTGDQKNNIAMGIAAGMDVLHHNHIIYRDLKSSNVLLENNYKPVICDFGAALFVEIDDIVPIMSRIGTPAWMAPELFKVGTYSNKVDVY